MVIYRFLTDVDFDALHETFLAAFSDYFVALQLTEQQFKNHIQLNSVDLKRSVGAFDGEKMVGFTLNGFGIWNGKKTIYDAGTGVVPAYRKRGIGGAIFDFMMPFFRQEGWQQLLLEVISQNEKAIHLYQKLGFETSRRLIFFERQKPFESKLQTAFVVREMPEPDWLLFKTFEDGKPSWQNSIQAMNQTPRKVILGAFLDEKCIGYGIFFPTTGMIPQLAVARDFRRRGAGSTLLREMQTKVNDGKNLRLSNVDENIASTVEFLKKRGFTEALSQLEMVKAL